MNSYFRKKIVVLAIIIGSAWLSFTFIPNPDTALYIWIGVCGLLGLYFMTQFVIGVTRSPTVKIVKEEVPVHEKNSRPIYGLLGFVGLGMGTVLQILNWNFINPFFTILYCIITFILLSFGMKYIKARVKGLESIVKDK